MPPHKFKLTDEQRRKLIYSVINEGKSIKETADEFQVPYVTVYAVINTFRRTGRINALKKGGDRRSKLNQIQHEWISQRVDEKPDITVKQLTQELCEEFDVQVSSSTISRVLAKRGFTVNRIFPDNGINESQVNELESLRETFMKKMQVIQTEFDGRVVYLGEAGYSIYLKQFYGRTSQDNTDENGESSKRSGQSVSVYLALKQEQLLHSDIQIGSFNPVTFTSFMNTVLEKLDEKSHCLVYDASYTIHEVILNELTQNTAHTLLALPPNSALLNPLEEAFISLKKNLRREKLTADDTLLMRFQETLDRLTVEDWSGWIQNITQSVDSERDALVD